MKLPYNIEITISKKHDFLLKIRVFRKKMMAQLPRFLTKTMHLAQNYWKFCKNRATRKWFHDKKGSNVKILPFVKTPL